MRYVFTVFHGLNKCNILKKRVRNDRFFAALRKCAKIVSLELLSRGFESNGSHRLRDKDTNKGDQNNH